MPDKRTFELSTIDVTVALINGLLVVDTADLAAADDEQQKVLIKTLLETFALSGADYATGNLKITRSQTTNPANREVLLADASGNVLIRDISELLQATGAVVSNLVLIENEAAESVTGQAETQAEVNQQNVAEFIVVNDRIDNIIDLGATGTVFADPTPQPMTTTTALFLFSVIFPSNNTNIIEFDEATNSIILKATGIYDLSWFINVANGSVSMDYEAQLIIRNAGGGATIEQQEILIPEAGYSGTVSFRFAVTIAPITIELAQFSNTDTNLSIESSLVSVTAVGQNGVPESANPYLVDVFGLDDPLQDAANIQAAVALSLDGYIIRLFGTFDLQDQIDLSNKDNLTIDGAAAFIKAIRNDNAAKVFYLFGSNNIVIKNINGTFESGGSISDPRFISCDVSEVCDNLRVENIIFPWVAGAYTNQYLIVENQNGDYTKLFNIFSNEGEIIVPNNAHVENVIITTGGKITAPQNCFILKNNVDNITTTATPNVITSNIVNTYTLNSGLDLLYVDLLENQTINGIKTFNENTYFLSDVGIGTSTPAEALDVNGNITTNFMRFRLATNISVIETFGGNGLNIYGGTISDPQTLNLGNAGTTQIKIASSGINTNIQGQLAVNKSTAPTQPLDVDGNADFSGRISARQTSVIQSDTENVGALIVRGSGNNQLLLERQTGLTGRVRIGWRSYKVSDNSAVNVALGFESDGGNPEKDRFFLSANDSRFEIAADGLGEPVTSRVIFSKGSVSINTGNTATEALDVNGNIITTATTTGQGNIGLRGSSGDGKSLQFFKFGTDSEIRFSHHQGGDGLRLIWISDDGLSSPHIAYFDGDTQRVGFGDGSSTAAPPETVSIYGRAYLATATEPSAPIGGISMYTEGGLLKYKNSSGVVYVLDNSGGASDYNHATASITDAGNIVAQFGTTTVTVSKTATGKYTITHNLGTVNYGIQITLNRSSISAPMTVAIPTRGTNSFEVDIYQGTALNDSAFFLFMNYQ